MNSSRSSELFESALCESLSSMKSLSDKKINQVAWSTPLCSNRKVRPVNLGKLITSTPAHIVMSDTDQFFMTSSVREDDAENFEDIRILPMDDIEELPPYSEKAVETVPRQDQVLNTVLPNVENVPEVPNDLTSKLRGLRLNCSLSPLSKKIVARIIESSPEVPKKTRVSSRRCLRL